MAVPNPPRESNSRDLVEVGVILLGLVILTIIVLNVFGGSVSKVLSTVSGSV